MKKKLNFKFILFIFCFFNNFSTDITISYLIVNQNNISSLKKLLNLLVRYKNKDDEIIIIENSYNNLNLLKRFNKNLNIKVFKNKSVNLAEQLNFGKMQCKGNYIFNIFSDEIPSTYLIQNLKKMIVMFNSQAFALFITLNTSFNKKFWPNFQIRIIENNENIYWNNTIDSPIGFDKLKILPEDYNYCIYKIV